MIGITNFTISYYGLEANSCEHFFHMIQAINDLQYLLTKQNR